MIITGGWDHFVSGPNGGNGSLDWVRANENGRTYTAGVAVFSIAHSQWAFGRGAVAFRPQQRISLLGEATIGGGHTAGTSFGYQIYGGGLAYKASQHLYLKLGDEYLHIGVTRGDLFKPGAMFLLTKRLATDFTYAHSAGGNLDTQFLSGRLDFKLRPVNLMGGFAVGQAAPELFNLRTNPMPAKKELREGFLGLGVPLSRAEVTLVSDFLNLEATHKRTLTLSLKLPLRGQ